MRLLRRTLTLGVVLGAISAGPAHAQVAGSLDPTFDGDGMAMGAPFRGPAAMDLESDGDIVLTAGQLDSSNDFNAWLLRSPPDGAPLSTFAFLPNTLFFDQVIQPDGKIVAAGGTQSGQMLAARFNPDGGLDTSFSGDGIFTSSDSDYAISVALAPDGKIVLGGNGHPASGSEIVLKRLNPDGSDDQTYSADLGIERLEAITVQSDGKPVAVGKIDQAGDQNWLVLRLTTAFAPDPSFTPPTLDFGSDFDIARDVTLQSDGRIIVGGQSRPDNGPAAVVRLLADGTLDPSFDGDGIAVIPTDPNGFFPGASVVSVALDAQGRVLAGGYRDLRGKLFRLNSDGSPDDAFISAAEFRVPDDIEPLQSGKILTSFPGQPFPETAFDLPPGPNEPRNGQVGVMRLLGAAVAGFTSGSPVSGAAPVSATRKKCKRKRPRARAKCKRKKRNRVAAPRH